MTARATSHRQFAVHGLAVELLSDVPLLDEQIDHALFPFAASALPEGFTCTTGQLRPYEQSEVMRHLSPTAVPLATTSQLTEIYQEAERFWLVDDRWGLCEINMMKGTWRSWVLPTPTLDSVRVTEMAVLWPMAQLLRPRGLTLLPAASASRAGQGVLIISPFNLEGELRALVRAGYNIVGQRWTSIREDAGKVELLHMPGQIERESSPRLRDASLGPASRWVDLTSEYCGISQNCAACDTVLIVEPGRRPNAHINEVTAQRASDLMRKAWPIVELHPFRRHGQLPLKLAQASRCWQVQLSRTPEDLLVLLDSIRTPACTAIVATKSAALSAPPAYRMAM